MTQEETKGDCIIEISTHTSLAGRDIIGFIHIYMVYISTHTSLAGRDAAGYTAHGRSAISTHTSLAGRGCHACIVQGSV